MESSRHYRSAAKKHSRFPTPSMNIQMLSNYIATLSEIIKESGWRDKCLMIKMDSHLSPYFSEQAVTDKFASAWVKEIKQEIPGTSLLHHFAKITTTKLANAAADSKLTFPL